MTGLRRRLAQLALVAALPAAALPATTPAFAETDSDAAYTASRTSLAGNYLAARIAGSQRDATAASVFFRAALQDDPRNPELLERTFLVTLVNGDVDGSMRLAERVVAIDPANRMARLALAARAIKTQNYAAARHHLARGAKGPLADLTVNLISGWAWLGSGQTRDALEAVDKLQSGDFFATFRDYHAAMIADLGGRPEEAAKRFTSALGGDGAALRIVQSAALFRARNGDKAGALKLLDDFEKLSPRHPLVRQARTAIEQGKDLPRPVADASEGAAEVLYGIGSALGRQGGEDLSLVYLQLALYLEPNHPMALLTAADLYDQLNQFQDAIDIYARVPDSSPLKRNAEIQSAIDLDRLDKTDEAKAKLARLIDADGGDQEAIVALGNIERGREQFKGAAETYTRAIDLLSAARQAPAAAPEAAQPSAAPQAAQPSVAASPVSYVVKPGDTLWKIAGERLGDPKRWRELQRFNSTAEAIRQNGGKIGAELTLGQSIMIPGAPKQSAAAPVAAAPAGAPVEPQHPSIVDAATGPSGADWSLFYVRGIAYERSNQWEKSEADLKEALKLSPDQPMVMNYLGYSWIDKNQNLEEGVKLIKRAVELKPDDGYIVDSLGWAYYRMGKYDDAVLQLERAVELRPQDPVMNDHLGDAYWRVGRKIEAGFQWTHAKDLKPEPADLAKIEAKLKDGLPDAPKTDSAAAGEKREGG